MRTYWNKQGKHQAEYERLWTKLVPDCDMASTVHGELLRCMGRLSHDRNNNSGCNFDMRNMVYAAYTLASAWREEIREQLCHPDDLEDWIKAYESHVRSGRSYVPKEWQVDQAFENIFDAVVEIVIEKDAACCCEPRRTKRPAKKKKTGKKKAKKVLKKKAKKKKSGKTDNYFDE